MLATGGAVVVDDGDCATVRLQKAVRMLHHGTELNKFMRSKPTSEPNRYTFRVEDLFLCWTGKASKAERRRIVRTRKGTALRPTCNKSFTLTLLNYGDMALAADSRGIADMWVNGLQYMLWTHTRERAGMRVTPIAANKYVGDVPFDAEARRDLEERAQRYRRVAVCSGNSGETYKKIKVKTAATKKNQSVDSRATKTPEECSTLSAMVHDIPFFSIMSIDVHELCVEKLCKEEMRAGETIIHQGEVGDKLYVLENGRADVIVENLAETSIVHTAEPGSWFGEIALLFDTPRTATVRAKTDVKLWSLSRDDFRVIGELSQDWAGLLNDVPELALLSKAQLDDLTSNMKVVELREGDILEQLHDTPTSMYIVVLGGVRATAEVSMLQGEKSKVRSFSDSAVSIKYGPGDVICLEEALKGRENLRTYTVTENDTSLIKIDRKYIMKYKNELTQAANDFFKWKVLRKVPMLTKLVRQDGVELFDNFVTRTYDRGEYVIEQYATGDEFFIISEGFVTVKRRAGPDDPKMNAKNVVILGSGQYFGELALLSGEPRSADVVVTSEQATFFVLSRSGWESLMGKLSVSLEVENNKKMLHNVPLLSHLNDDTLTMMSKTMTSVSCAVGDEVVTEGDTEPEKMAFYIITSGEFEVRTGRRGIVATLGVGDYFGERALLEATPRSATITCVREAKCLMMTGEELSRHMHHVKNQLLINIEESRKQEELTDSYSSKRLSVFNLDSIELRQTLGEGAFGKVTLGVHRRTGTPIAMKSIVKERLVTENRLRHLQDEVTILRKVQHPFVVQLYSTNMDDVLAYLMMEYLPGGEVFTLLQKRQFFKEEETRFYVSQVISAFNYLHMRDIIYRDLKPENMVFDAQGYVKIVDFGFAKIVPRGYVTMTVCGTPDYVAPEVCKHDSSSFFSPETFTRSCLRCAPASIANEQLFCVRAREYIASCPLFFLSQWAN